METQFKTLSYHKSSVHVIHLVQAGSCTGGRCSWPTSASWSSSCSCSATPSSGSPTSGSSGRLSSDRWQVTTSFIIDIKSLLSNVPVGHRVPAPDLEHHGAVPPHDRVQQVGSGRGDCNGDDCNDDCNDDVDAALPTSTSTWSSTGAAAAVSRARPSSWRTPTPTLSWYGHT